MDEDTPKQSRQERIMIYEAALNINPIDLNVIRRLAFQGIPDKPGLRAIYWKILLGFLPLEQSKWEKETKFQRQVYQEWIKELILDPHAKYAKYVEENPDSSKVEDVTFTDHPLSMSQESTWGQYFKDCEMMDEIDKDVKRTFPHLHFFNKDGKVGCTRHYEALKRILFIYAKLNPGIRYVQGMNEVLGPLYYICARDMDESEFDEAESDAFHCFKNLMGEIRDNFCKTLDHSDLGVTGTLQKFTKLLSETDYEVYEHLEKQNMNPQFYGFRWITLLLSQEFDLPEVIQLWDCLFADADRFKFLLYCCCAMIHCIRDKILSNDSFGPNLQILQTYPQEIELSTILKKAIELRDIRENGLKPPTPEPQPESFGSAVLKFFTS